MIDVTAHSHLQSSCQCLEDALYLVVLISAFCLDVQVHLSGITQTLEEMQEHLRRHLSYLLTMKLSIPYQPGTTSEVEATLHRQSSIGRQ